MAALVKLWGLAVLIAVALAVAGHATQNETLMLVAFFTCKLLWFLYLALLLEWLARLQRVKARKRPPSPRFERRATTALTLDALRPANPRRSDRVAP